MCSLGAQAAARVLMMSGSENADSLFGGELIAVAGAWRRVAGIDLVEVALARRSRRIPYVIGGFPLPSATSPGGTQNDFGADRYPHRH